MVNKRFWLVILALVLVSGMTIVGCDNGITDFEESPEEKTTAERWGKWVDPDSDVILNYSVSSDNVCTITVGGTPVEIEWERWKANCGYAYTARKDTNYTYKFEAWTQNGDRDINVQYYADNTDSVYMGKLVSITSERKTYTIVGKPLLKGNVWNVEFQCADKLGTFYVKMLSITEGGDYDYIKIRSVTPNSNLTDGVEQLFTIIVDYSLATQEQGLIIIGANNLNEPDSYFFNKDFNFIVNKGKSNHTFNITLLTKDWGIEEEFWIVVNLGYYLDGDPENWEWLAQDGKTLSFK
jgi:hypothetical protein